MQSIKILLILLLGSFYNTLFSQASYSVPQRIPDKYIINTRNEFDSFALNNRQNSDASLFNEFAEKAVYDKKSMTLNGNIYYGFDRYETYLNTILQRLLVGSDIENKQNFKAYLKYDDSYNAFALPDGTMLVTIGLMAECKNEDALACILAHEIAHVKYRDAYKEFKKNLEIDWREISYKELDKIFSSLDYSRAAEMRADSFGFYLARNAGFDIKQGFSNYDYIYRAEIRKQLYKQAKERSKPDKSIRFIPVSQLVKEEKTKKMEEEEDADNEDNDDKNTRKHKEGDEEKRYSTHPEIIDRVRLLYRILEDTDEHQNIKIVAGADKNIFEELQNIAKKERLREMLQAHEYDECMEASFIYHLSDTSNMNFIYYELEAIRRYLIIDDTRLHNGFLNFDLNKPLKKGKSILHLPLYLIPDSSMLKGLQGIGYFDSEYEFENYKQAFRYFFKKADASANAELNLTAGLFYKMFNIPKGDSLLRNYISNSGSKYRDYATSYMEGTLYTGLENNKRDIVICSDITVYTGTRKRFSEEYISSDSTTNEFAKDFNSFHNKKLKGTEVYFMAEQVKVDFGFLYSGTSVLSSLYFMINNVQNKKPVMDSKEDDDEADTVVTKEGKTQKKSFSSNDYSSYLYLLEPETWTFIKLNNIRSIGGFYATRLYDKQKVVLDVLANASGFIVPGALFVRSNVGSRANKNNFLYLHFQTAQTEKPIGFQFEQSKDSFRRMDYVNALYYKIVTNNNK
jgi:hypothetical protein